MLLVDAVQRIWNGFRNGSVPRLPYADKGLDQASADAPSMSDLLMERVHHVMREQSEPTAEGFREPAFLRLLDQEAADPFLPEASGDPEPEQVVEQTSEFVATVEELAEPQPEALPITDALVEVEPLDSLQRRAEQALAQANWLEAADLHEAMLLRQPEEAAHAKACAEAHRIRGDRAAADLVLQRFRSANGPSIGVAIAYALNAQAAQDWQQALQRWQDVRVAFGDLGTAWAAETAMLLILGRLDEAENVARQGVARLPGNIEILAQLAGVSIARQDWFGAFGPIRDIEEQTPLHPAVASHVASMRDLVLAHIDALPLPVLMDRAACAEQSRDWPVAAHVWRVVYERDPRAVRAIIGYGQALRESGAFDEADRILARGVAIIPNNQELFAHFAQVPAARHDWTTAAYRWQHILQLFPDTRAVWPMAATAYREAGLLEPADLLLSHAIAEEPTRADLRVQHALVAEQQKNWPLAVERWDIAHRLWPDEPNIRNSRGDAIWQEAWERLERGDSLSDAAEPPLANPAADMKQVALQFEGLGDNCEFGVVQRHFGADPIGLFRFAAISADTLTELLGEQFERLGDPKFTTLSLTIGNEYLVRDERGFYHLHSFVRKGSVVEEVFLHQQVKRLAYLKRKLLEDLRDSRKIFVHKSSLSRIDDETALRLHGAIGQFGPNILLVIRSAEGDQPPGALTVLRRGLLIGHVKTLYGGETSEIDFDSWRSVLLAAYDYRRNSAEHRPDMSGQ